MIELRYLNILDWKLDTPFTVSVYDHVQYHHFSRYITKSLIIGTDWKYINMIHFETKSIEFTM